jgi:hypothetical protein
VPRRPAWRFAHAVRGHSGLSLQRDKSRFGDEECFTYQQGEPIQLRMYPEPCTHDPSYSFSSPDCCCVRAELPRRHTELPLWDIPGRARQQILMGGAQSAQRQSSTGEIRRASSRTLLGRRGAAGTLSEREWVFKYPKMDPLRRVTLRRQSLSPSTWARVTNTGHTCEFVGIFPGIIRNFPSRKNSN